MYVILDVAIAYRMAIKKIKAITELFLLMKKLED
jgi:hypothetical protein